MMTIKEVDCLFCSCKAERNDKYSCQNANYFYRCPNCGNYQTTDVSEKIYLAEILSDLKNKAVLSYVIRRMYRKERYPLIDLNNAQQIIENNNLPSVADQANKLIGIFP